MFQRLFAVITSDVDVDDSVYSVLVALVQSILIRQKEFSMWLST